MVAEVAVVVEEVVRSCSTISVALSKCGLNLAKTQQSLFGVGLFGRGERTWRAASCWFLGPPWVHQD